jgi:hypothetical protein
MCTPRDEKQANRITEKEAMLRPESFPPNAYLQYFEIPPVGLAHESVTEPVIERALFSHSVKETLGPDKLSFGALRPLW